MSRVLRVYFVVACMALIQLLCSSFAVGSAVDILEEDRRDAGLIVVYAALVSEHVGFAEYAVRKGLPQWTGPQLIRVIYYPETRVGDSLPDDAILFLDLNRSYKRLYRVLGGEADRGIWEDTPDNRAIVEQTSKPALLNLLRGDSVSENDAVEAAISHLKSEVYDEQVSDVRFRRQLAGWEVSARVKSHNGRRRLLVVIVTEQGKVLGVYSYPIRVRTRTDEAEADAEERVTSPGG